MAWYVLINQFGYHGSVVRKLARELLIALRVVYLCNLQWCTAKAIGIQITSVACVKVQQRRECRARQMRMRRKQTDSEEIEKTYRWLVCSWSLLSGVGCEPERRSRQMAWRAATSRAKPCRATTDALHAHSTHHQQVRDSARSRQDRTGWDQQVDRNQSPGRLSQN